MDSKPSIEINQDLQTISALPISTAGKGENSTRDEIKTVDGLEINTRQGENSTRDETETIDALKIECVILSPGPDKGENSTEFAIQTNAYSNIEPETSTLWPGESENSTRYAAETVEHLKIEPATSTRRPGEVENSNRDEAETVGHLKIEAATSTPRPSEVENSTRDEAETVDHVKIELAGLVPVYVEGENIVRKSGTETEDDLKIEVENSTTTGLQLNRSRSASSSSSSSSSSSLSSSSSEDCFQIGVNENTETPLGSTDSLPLADHDHNGLQSSHPETSQTLSNCSIEIPSKACEEIDLFSSIVSSNNSLSVLPLPSASQTPPKVTFQITTTHEDPRAATEPRDENFQRIGSSPELAGPLSKPATFVTQFPPSQTMERPNNELVNSSGYRIPSYVFARTKSNAPVEWSTASNESLFSIHMGNASFNRDQLFWLGKSGELAMSNPFLDFPPNTNPQPVMSSNKPAHTSNTSDEDFRVAEAKAAETMRQVIRESDENRAKEEAAAAATATAAKEVQPSAKISRISDENTKSFAFPKLTGDGDKSVSNRMGAAKQSQHSQSRTPNSPPVVTADSGRANRIMGQYRWFSYPCFTCCRSSCY